MLVFHCSASDEDSQDSIEAIKHLHTANKKTKIKWGKYDTTGKNWSDIGYQIVITKDGKRHYGRPLEKAGAHCKGYNKNSIGICLTGDKEFTEAQFEEAAKVASEYLEKFDLEIYNILGHSDLNKNKSCPNYDIKEIIKRLGQH